ncbi:MAG TPA: hypothetical protein VMY06_02670 [Sedimentisphaerales bacterium]|nr:hypothetical protein [Sedimentisphaerales bacterium]
MRSKNLLAVAAGLVACVLVVWSSKSIQGGQKKYELRPQVTIPEYRTDTARAIDAYERLMNRYMSLTERNLIRIETKLGNIVKQLDSIDYKLTELSARMTKIEKALVTSQAKPSVEGVPQHKQERLAPQKKRQEKLSPSS